MLGQPRSLVVCDEVEIDRPASLDSLLDTLYAENHIRRRVDGKNNVMIETLVPAYGGGGGNWSLHEHQVKSSLSMQIQFRLARRSVMEHLTSFLSILGDRSVSPSSLTGD